MEQFIWKEFSKDGKVKMLIFEKHKQKQWAGVGKVLYQGTEHSRFIGVYSSGYQTSVCIQIILSSRNFLKSSFLAPIS